METFPLDFHDMMLLLKGLFIGELFFFLNFPRNRVYAISIFIATNRNGDLMLSDKPFKLSRIFRVYVYKKYFYDGYTDGFTKTLFTLHTWC